MTAMLNPNDDAMLMAIDKPIITIDEPRMIAVWQTRPLTARCVSQLTGLSNMARNKSYNRCHDTLTMKLNDLVSDLKGYPGITRKKAISSVINFFPKVSSSKVLASYGEDAAVMEHNGEAMLLAATASCSL